MTIREFHAATTELETLDTTFAAVQELRSADAAPAIFEGSDDMQDWDPWG